MRKVRWGSILLGLMMLLTLLTATAFADDSIKVTTFDQLKNAATAAAEGTTVEVSGDITMTEPVVFTKKVNLVLTSTANLTYTSDNNSTICLITVQDGSTVAFADGASISMIGDLENRTDSRDWRVIRSLGTLTFTECAGTVKVQNAKCRAFYGTTDLVFNCDMAADVTIDNTVGANRYVFALYAINDIIIKGDLSGSIDVDFGGGNTGAGLYAGNGIQINGDISGSIDVKLGTSHKAFGLCAEGEHGIKISGDISGSIYARGGSSNGFGILAYDGDIAVAAISGTVTGDCYNDTMNNSQSGASAIYALSGSVYGTNNEGNITPVQLTGTLSSTVGRNDAFTVQAAENVYIAISGNGSIKAQSSFGADWTDLDVEGGYQNMSNNWGGAAAGVVAGGEIEVSGTEAIVVTSESESGEKISSGFLKETGSLENVTNISDFLYEVAVGNEEAALEANEKLTEQDKAQINGYDEIIASLTTVTVGNGEEYDYATIQEAVDAVENGGMVVVAPGCYSENVNFKGKSLTIKAQYPAYNNGVAVSEEKRTEFTGTMSTYYSADGVTFEFAPDQKVVIDGIYFTGDGLKVGDNQNSLVGNLTVENCVMVPGKNLDASTVGKYGDNKANYFVKTQGNHTDAVVVLRNNLVTGTPVVCPVQLWSVKAVTVEDNVFAINNAATGAINVSKMAHDAVVSITGNKIDTYEAITVNTWRLDNAGYGNVTGTFTGKVTVQNNTLTGTAPAGEKDPVAIFVGADANAADNGDFNGAVLDNGNTLNGKPIVAVIGYNKDQNVSTNLVTFVSNGVSIAQFTVNDRIALLAVPTLQGYTFMGWKSSADGKVYDAGEKVEITKDTTFTALWQNNLGIIGDIIGGAVEEKEFFTDVSMGDWYYEAVKFCFDYDLMNGVGNGKFSPDTTLTRAMLAQVLYNLDEARGSYAGVFTDVTGSAWYANAVNWAAASGIVEGKGNNKFDPDAPVTRQEMAAIFYRYASYKGYDVSAAASLDRFTDASKVASWAKDAMSWAVGGYVINGKGAGRLDPTGTATRAEVAQILMNFCNNVL